MNSTKNSVSIKVFKYFMFDGEGSMLEDYSYTELDNDRVEADLDSKKLNLKIVDNFAGVFVQDRFTLPLDGDDAMGVIRFEEVIDLIKNELKNVPDKLAVLKRYNLKNHEIRVEMESHVGIENNSPKLSQIVTNLERMVEEVKADSVLIPR
jgi:Zn-dependent M16 (insulinase) family peptidase